MTSTTRPRPRRSSTRTQQQLLVGVPLALAVLASLFLVLSDSVALLRLGVAVALWAAVVAAIALNRSQRESKLAEIKAADLQTVYDLQLDREIAARREYELGVEARLRQEMGADAAELAALRAELASLRRQLEVLFDGGLGPERTALRAEAARIDQERIAAREAARAEIAAEAPIPAETTPVEPESGPTPPAQAEQPRRRHDAGRREAPAPAEAESEEAGAHTSGMSVAELMARLAAGDGESGSSGGRRRRAE